MEDLRYAIRAAFRSPIAALVVILSLTLGIGANTAVFSFVDAVQFKPLPFADEATLVDVHEWSATELCAGCGVGTSYPGYQDLRARTTSYSAIGAYVESRVAVSGGGDPERIGGALVSAGLFPMLGIQPALGRHFTDADDSPGAAPVALISDSLWKRRFGADPGVLARTVRIDGADYTILGVMPAGFRFPESADVWRPLAPNAIDWKRSDRSLGVIARLRPGVSVEQARQEAAALALALEREHPETNARWTASATPLRQDLTEETAMASLVFMSAVGFVLLIACANVANLLLVRASERRREIAMRLALGATRARIIRLVLIETLLLAAIGGAGGILLALWTSGAIVSALGDDAPYWIDFGIDVRVLAFAILATTVTGILCGLLPALHAARQDPQSVLKEGANSSAAQGGRRVLGSLVVAQLALSLMLLAGAGLLVKTAARTFRHDPGYDATRLVAGDVSLRAPRYERPAEVRSFAEAVVAQLERRDGVRAAMSRTVFFAGFGGTRRTIDVDGLRDVPAGGSPTFYAAVTPGYFDVYFSTFVEGRPFTAPTDRDVVVVNQTMATRLWPGQPAVGHRIRFGSEGPWLTVIGVMRDAGGGGLGREPSPFAYVPFEAGSGTDLTVTASTTGDASSLIPEVRAAVRAADPDQPVEDVMTLDAAHARWASPPRFIALMMATLAAIALGLAAIGTYGVVAYNVSRRTRELGIRIALGASGRQVARMVTASALRMALIALAIGVPGAWATTRTLEGVLFGTSPTDPLVFTLATLGLMTVALAASWYPARRAARVDPVAALRAE